MARNPVLALTVLCAWPGMTQAAADIADAAMQRDTGKVRELLLQGADIDSRQADGATALHWAAYYADANLAEILLDAGADPALANRNGSTPLWLAADRGDAALIRLLLAAGANANEELPLGRRPLMLAARSGSIDAVRALLQQGADPNARESERGTTALMQAADQGHADVISVLIENGADFTAGSAPLQRDGRTAALGKANDPRESVRRQVISIICEQESPDIGVLRELAAEDIGATEDALLAEFNLSDTCNIERDALGFARVVGERGRGGGPLGNEPDPEFEDDGLELETAAEFASDDEQTQPERAAGRGRGGREPDGGELEEGVQIRHGIKRTF